MEVDLQKATNPAQKIIYVTPQSRTNLGIVQHNVNQTSGTNGNVKITIRTNQELKGGGGDVKDERPKLQPSAPRNTREGDVNLNIHPKVEPIGKDEFGNCWLAGSTNASCQVDTDSSTQRVLTQSVMGTQTNYQLLPGQTVFDEMKRKANETFQKLDLYQILVGQTEEKKSALLPGTDSEYRTPGAHFRNKNGQIKRPMNAFMVWAREFRGKLAAAMPHATNSDISIKLGQVWSSLPPEQKMQYYNIAEKIKVKHRQDFPDWTYKPVPTIKRKESSQIENSTPVQEQRTPLLKHTALPPIPFLNFGKGINRNQSATTTTTRIPVILQPVTYQQVSQHMGPAVSQSVKDKLVDKISGSGNKQPVITGGINNSVESIPVRKIEIIQDQGEIQTAGLNNEVLRKVLIQTTPPDHPQLGGSLLSKQTIQEVQPHIDRSQPAVKSEPPASTVTYASSEDTKQPSIRHNGNTITNHSKATSVIKDKGDCSNSNQSLEPNQTEHLPKVQTKYLQMEPTKGTNNAGKTQKLPKKGSETTEGVEKPKRLSKNDAEQSKFARKTQSLLRNGTQHVNHAGKTQTLSKNGTQHVNHAGKTPNLPRIANEISKKAGETKMLPVYDKELIERATHCQNSYVYGNENDKTAGKTQNLSDNGTEHEQRLAEKKQDFVINDKDHNGYSVNPFECSRIDNFLNDIRTQGPAPSPMFNEFLDPFDPLMDCDFLYSELYPGCLHLDVSRWREYLDISSDDENDPLSRFQDDSEDDIKISPVPLKETLRRMCNAHVQRSVSGHVIVGDVMIPISDASAEVEVTNGANDGHDSGETDSSKCIRESGRVKDAISGSKLPIRSGRKTGLESSCAEMAIKAGPSTRNGSSLGVC